MASESAEHNIMFSSPEVNIAMAREERRQVYLRLLQLETFPPEFEPLLDLGDGSVVGPASTSTPSITPKEMLALVTAQQKQG